MQTAGHCLFNFGVIDIIQDNSPYITISDGRVHFPTGLLIEKWMIYYYPILESTTYIPQINGALKLAFANQLKQIIADYKNNGGFSVFYNDLKTKGIPESLQPAFMALAKKLQDTTTRMPMKYIGRSITEDFYSIFNYQNKSPGLHPSGTIDIEFLIKSFGSFSIPYEYYEAFKVLGSFIGGQDSILFKWAEFSVNASGKRLSIANLINEVLKSPVTERNVAESRNIYKSVLKKEGKVYCVWTGKAKDMHSLSPNVIFPVILTLPIKSRFLAGKWLMM